MLAKEGRGEGREKKGGREKRLTLDRERGLLLEKERSFFVEIRWEVDGVRIEDDSIREGNETRRREKWR